MNFNQLLDSLDLQVGSPHCAWLGAFALVAMAVSIWAGVRQQRALQAFGATSRQVGSQSIVSRMASTLAVMLSIVLLSIALMDIRWGKTTYEVPQKGLKLFLRWMFRGAC